MVLKLATCQNKENNLYLLTTTIVLLNANRNIPLLNLKIGYEKNFTILACLLFSYSVFSQEIIKNREYYLKKSKSQKTAAWILLGGGTALIGVGALVGNQKESSFDDAATGGIVAGVGILSMIGSIPLFIASRKNKRKGMAITFRNTPAARIKNSSLVYQPMPAVSIRINL